MTQHLPIQRWTKIFCRYPASEVLPNENGEYVTYADHLAALHACEERVLDAAREAVASMPLTGGWTTPDGVIEEIDKAKTVAAIDALLKEN